MHSHHSNTRFPLKYLVVQIILTLWYFVVQSDISRGSNRNCCRTLFDFIFPGEASYCPDASQICSPYANCQLNNQHKHLCVCKAGFYGNGIYCQLLTTDVAAGKQKSISTSFRLTCGFQLLLWFFINVTFYLLFALKRAILNVYLVLFLRTLLPRYNIM